MSLVLGCRRAFFARSLFPYQTKGKKYYENQIWIQSGLGHPDLIDRDIIIEAKGGLPSANKVQTALGQLLSYTEHEPSFRVGFLFQRIWLEAESLQKKFEVLKEHNITLLPI